MDRLKRRGEKSQKRKSQQRKSQKKEDQVAWKGRKVAKCCVFSMFCGCGGLNTSRSAKAQAVAPVSPVAPSAFRSQNLKLRREAYFDNALFPEQFWEFRCSKSAHHCGRKHTSKSRCAKHTTFWALLEVVMLKSARKCGAREAPFQVKMLKTPHAQTTFGRSNRIFPVKRKGFCTLSKVSQTCGFCSSCKNNGKRMMFEEDLQRLFSRGYKRPLDQRF